MSFIDDAETFFEVQYTKFSDAVGINTAADKLDAAGNAAKSELAELGNKAKSALQWGPWLVGGALAIAGLVVVGPYVLPIIGAWRDALRK